MIKATCHRRCGLHRLVKTFCPLVGIQKKSTAVQCLATYCRFLEYKARVDFRTKKKESLIKSLGVIMI